MNEKIERVARAISYAGGTDWDKLPKQHGPGFSMRQMYTRMAEAAVKAMREPTREKSQNYEERFCCDECEKQDDDFRNRHRFLLEEMDKLRSENEKLKESLKQIADWSSPTNTPPTKSTLLPLLETSMIAINRIIKEALK